LRIIGIDPGLQGGIALLEDGLIAKLIKMPLTKIETKTKKKVKEMTKAEKKLHKQKKPIYKKKDIVNSKAIYDLVLNFKPDLVVIEKPFYLGINSSVVVGTTAENVGRLYGITEGLGHKILRVPANSWKGYFDLEADKENAIAKAEELFPQVNLIPPRCREKQDGLAEALLLAVYGSRPSKEDF
jgi:Holliday junction resolvasome RuvABC endonuclease subunit